MNSFFRAVETLWVRDMVRFYRQPSRVVGAVASPFIFWLLIGSGVGRTFGGGQDYLIYFLPGAVLLVIFFTAIFSTISLIEDRKEGFLQGVLVAPVSRAAIVFGKVLGSAALAGAQAILFLVISFWAGVRLSAADCFFLILMLLLNSIMLSSMGFWMAWKFHSVQGFHAVMNVLLMPMWLLSGALFPFEGAAKWIQWIMLINPLHYGWKLIHSILSPLGGGYKSGDFLIALSVCLIWTAAVLILSIRDVKKPKMI